MEAKLYFIIFITIFGTIKANLQFYGNEAKQRFGVIDANLASPGGRMWVDDPLNGESYPGWGYLSYYLVYIDALSNKLAPIQLHIWTSIKNELRNYNLKFSYQLENYQPGILYKIPVPLNTRGFPLEITGDDRLGFAHTANSTPISFDPLIDDTSTATTAHRTYYLRLNRLNGSLPNVNNRYLFSNDAVRGIFSIGVLLDNEPPLALSEQYIGAELQSSELTFKTTDVVILRGYKLRQGQLTNIFLRFNATSGTQVSMDLLLWKSVNNFKYTLVYSQRLDLSININDPYTKAKLNNGPRVDESTYLGFRMVNADSDLYYRVLPQTENYFLVNSKQQLSNGQSYTSDTLRQFYEFSLGVSVSGNFSATYEAESRKNNAFNPINPKIKKKKVPTATLR